jgi:hypothetical protein
MRKRCFLPLLALLAIGVSCKKEVAAVKENSVQEDVVLVNIKTEQPYTFNFPEAGDAIIVKQAAHFSLSETRIDEQRSTPYYTYIPSKGFKGTDEVVLQLSKTIVVSSEQYYNGCTHDKTATAFDRTTIRITVGD